MLKTLKNLLLLGAVAAFVGAPPARAGYMNMKIYTGDGFTGASWADHQRKKTEPDFRPNWFWTDALNFGPVGHGMDGVFGYLTGEDIEGRNNFLGHAQGFLVFPEAGEYLIHITSDDRAELFVSSDADPANLATEPLVRHEDACCYADWAGAELDRRTASITVTKGERRYVELFLTEGGGGDWVRVSWQRPDGTRERIPSAHIENLAPDPDPAGLPYDLAIPFPPTDVLVTENNPATFEVGAFASQPVSYKWFVNGTEVTDSETSNLGFYRIDNVTPSMNGDAIRVEVTDGDGGTLEAEAFLTVDPDIAPPVLSSIGSRGNPRGIFAVFSEPVDGLLEMGNYDFGDLTISSMEAWENNDGIEDNAVLFNVTPDLTEGQVVNYSVSGLRDRAASPNQLAPNPTEGTFEHGAEYPAGRIHFLRYLNSNGNTVGTLLGNANFPDNPDLVGTLPALEHDPGFSADNYGEWIFGFLIAPITGTYHFASSSDNGSETWLSTDELQANRRLITSEPEWNGSRNFTGLDRRNATAPQNRSTTRFPDGIDLVEGNVYFLEAFFQEGGGGDNYSTTWQKPGDPAIVNGQDPISADNFAESRHFNGQLFNTLGDVFFTAHPLSVTVFESDTATFSGSVDGTPPYSFQWQVKLSGEAEYSDILGATGQSYSVQALVGNHEAEYRLVVRNEFSEAASDPAVLTVDFDTIPPALSEAKGHISLIYAVLEFDEVIDAATVIPANFSVATTDGGTALPVTGATLLANGQTVFLQTNPQAEGTGYTVSFENVADVALGGNIGSGSAEFTSFVTIDGHLEVKIYTGIGGGAIDPFYSQPRGVAQFPAGQGPYGPGTNNGTSGIEGIHEFATLPGHLVPGNQMDNYGTIMAGYFTPSVTGNHIFYMSCDDNGELYISSDDDPANSVLVASEPVWNGNRSWTTLDRRPNAENRSEPIAMVAGERYYIESISKEGGGGDGHGVTFILEGDPEPADGSLPTLGSHLSVPMDPTGASVEITQQPQADRTVEENNDAVLSVDVLATGTGGVVYDNNAHFQWYRNDEFIVGGNTRVFNTGFLSLGDDADYRVQVSVPGAQAWSEVVSITVVTDDTPPIPLTATPDGSFTSVAILFNERVDIATAEVAGNYSIDGLTVDGAVLQADERTVVLTTSVQDEATTYTATVTGVTDLAGNAAEGATVSFTTYIISPGLVKWELFTGVADRNIANRFNHAAYPNSPNQTEFFPDMDGGGGGNILSQRFGGGSLDDFIVRMTGLFCPPRTGYYDFFIRADDQALLFVGEDATPFVGDENLVPAVASELSGCCQGFQEPGVPETTAAPIFLDASQKYFIEFLVHEFGGGDWGQVAYRFAGIDESGTGADTTPAGSLTPITGAEISNALPTDGASVMITEHPQDATVSENQSAVLSAAATGTSPLGTTISIKWERKNPGAADFVTVGTGSPFTTSLLTLADSGVEFRAVASIAGARATSNVATITVGNDNDAPELAAASGDQLFTSVILTWNELVDPVSAADPSNYSVTGLTVDDAVLQSDGQTVVLTTSQQEQDTEYTVTADNVADLATTPNTASGASIAFTSFSWKAGRASAWIYSGIGDVILDAITFNRPSFGVESLPNGQDEFTPSPDIIEFPPLLEFPFNEDGSAPGNFADNYGVVIWGRICPPDTGDYIFHISADDNAEFYLSDSEDPVGAVLLATEPTWNGVRDYNGVDRRNPDAPENISPPVTLTAGRYYWFEAWMKEGGGGDNLSVAWRRAEAPADTVTEPIPGEFLMSILPPQPLIPDEFFIQVATNPDGSITISWDLEVGVLVKSNDVKGPYAPVAGAVSPFTITPDEDSAFYQIEANP